MIRSRLLRIVSMAILLPLLTACSADSDASADTATSDVVAGFETVNTSDTGGAETTPDAAQPGDADGGPVDHGQPPVGSVCPETMATLTIAVDDSANKTYAEGELIWTGSFSWDEASNNLTYATSWLPTEGPYPYLRDDGPVSAGGHEPEGAVAGDHIWSAAVCYLADQDRTFAYGLLNDDLRWIWRGANGQTDVLAGTTGVVEIPGMAVQPHGDRDFKVMLELAALHADFEGVSLDEFRVYVKGTMNSWAAVQLLDDGLFGDASAADGVVTYQHSNYLGKHDGLMRPGDKAQFVFVFAREGVKPDDGLEYKVEGNAAPEGVSGEAECDAGWIAEEVTLELDSKGKSENTTITPCAGEAPTPECSDSKPCPSGQGCEAGKCVPDTPTPDCDDSNPCPQGQDCVQGVCVTPPECSDALPCTGEGETCYLGTCVSESDAPEIFLVYPAVGATAGGTVVTIQGARLASADAVLFGDQAAIVQSAADTELSVITPAHAAGTVDVVVHLANGKEATFAAGFEFSGDAPGAVQIADASPSQVSPFGGTQVTVTGQGFDATCTVQVGGIAANVVSVTPPSQVVFDAPAGGSGDETVVLTCAEGAATTTLDYAGSWDGSMGEWPPAAMVASNSVVSDWGEGNTLSELWLYSDGVSLFVGIAGVTSDDQGANGIVAYVDGDFGGSTGLTDTTGLETDGAVDDVLGGLVEFSGISGFGAEVAMGQLTGASYRPGVDDPGSSAAGWRGLDPTDNLPWLLDAAVHSGGGGVEAILPLADLYGAPTGATRTVGVVVRLVSTTGEYASNQMLPESGAATLELSY